MLEVADPTAELPKVMYFKCFRPVKVKPRCEVCACTEYGEKSGLRKFFFLPLQAYNYKALAKARALAGAVAVLFFSTGCP